MSLEMIDYKLFDAFNMIIILIFANNVSALSRLSEHIEDFEYATYDKNVVHSQHLRHKVSIPQEKHEVELQFESFGRDFHLRLKKDHSIFHEQYSVEGPLGQSLNHLDHTHYEGYIVDEPRSHVFGSLRDGIFDGQITTARDGVFFVERAHRYFPRQNFNSSQHSVIYHEKHIHHPTTKSNLKAPAICDEASDWMMKVQSSGEQLHESVSSPVKPAPLKATPPLSLDISDPDPVHKYTAGANRVKRSTCVDPPTKNKTCSLFIQTDPQLWRHIKTQEKNDGQTQEEILSLIAQHVKAVNRIYGNTEFCAEGYRHVGHTFEVKRIKIHNDSDCSRATPDQRFFCKPNIDVSNFLNLHSKTNHEDYCLAYVFTYRDFTGGTLGLAWVASASGASGGICEKYKTYTENNQGIKRSLNTGIITFVNYNTRVPPKVSQLTLAHEIGHNFGSPHDYPESCQPGGAKGNYIMFASATSGDRDNNNKFSSCSMKNISRVLDAVKTNKHRNCFEESNGAFCGNKIVEDNEECDCGFDENECAEQCCYPRVTKGFTDRENKLKRCTRKPMNTDTKYPCSPSEGPCCTHSCQFVSGHQKLCKQDDECTKPAFCNGHQATCPKPEDKIDIETECNEGTKVCLGGECKGSICQKFGLEQCFLSSNDPERRYSTRDLCELACQEKNRSDTCKSTDSWTDEVRGPNQSLSLRPGSPCDNFQGYCDVFYKCRQVDAEGPLVRLKNLLFNPKTLLSIAQWVTTYWYWVLVMGIAFLIFMALFIKCCAAHTPSSNPDMERMVPSLKVKETLSRPVQTLRRKRTGIMTPTGHLTGYSVGTNGVHSAGYSAQPSAPPPSYMSHGYGDGRGHYNRSQGRDIRRTSCPNNPRLGQIEMSQMSR